MITQLACFFLERKGHVETAHTACLQVVYSLNETSPIKLNRHVFEFEPALLRKKSVDLWRFTVFYRVSHHTELAFFCSEVKQIFHYTGWSS